MKFLVDTQLPPKLALWLLQKGFKAGHTTDRSNGHLLKDKEIRNLAIENEWIIVTKDSDFEDYFFVKGVPPRILLVTVGNCSNTQLIELFDTNFNIVLRKFEENCGLVILSRKEVIGYK